MVKRQSSAERVDALEQVLIDIWHHAQECDGTRGAQQSALDNIQTLIEDEMPDVHEYEPSESDQSEDSEESENSEDDDD